MIKKQPSLIILLFAIIFIQTCGINSIHMIYPISENFCLSPQLTINTHTFQNSYKQLKNLNIDSPSALQKISANQAKQTAKVTPASLKINIAQAPKLLYKVFDKINPNTNIIGIGIDHSSPLILKNVIRIIPWLNQHGYDIVGIEHFAPGLSIMLTKSIDTWIKEKLTCTQYRNIILARPEFYILKQYIDDMENDLQNSANVLSVNEYLVVLKNFRLAAFNLVPIDTRHIPSKYNNHFVHNNNTDFSSVKFLNQYLKKNSNKKAVIIYGFTHLWKKHKDNIQTALEKSGKSFTSVLWMRYPEKIDIELFKDEDLVIRLINKNNTFAFISGKLYSSKDTHIHNLKTYSPALSSHPILYNRAQAFAISI